MLKKFAAVLLATSMVTGAAFARDGGVGGTFGPMPGTNFTDMPNYPTKPAKSVKRAKHMRRHVRKHSIGYH